MSTLKTNNIQHVDRSDPSIIISTDGGVSIAGTLTYEDVTSVDAVGIVTAREILNAQKQVHVGTGVSIKAGGLNVTAGITTIQALQATTATFAGDVSIADKIFHTGNSGAAIRFPADNIFAIETGGSEKARVTSGGDFGLGISSPAAKLSIHETSTTSASSQLMRITTANGALFGIETDETISNPTWKIGGVVNSGTAEPLAFYQLGSEKLRIDSSGRLLLGTTTEGAADADDFTVSSSSNTTGITIRTNTSGTGRLWFSDGTSGGAEYEGYVQYDHVNNKLQLGAAQSTRLTINSAGNSLFTGIVTATNFTSSGTVLIDTTSYTEATGDADDLIIGSTSDTQKGISIVGSTSGGIGNLYFTDGVGYKNQGRISYHHADDSLRLQTNVTERFRIDSSGNVTVKTNDVTFGGAGTLRINSGSTAGALNLDGGSSNHGGEINLLGGSNGGRITFRTGQGSGQQSEKMRLDENGRLGINENSPDNLLHITDGNPYIEIEGTSNSGDAGIFFNAKANHWNLRADNSGSQNSFGLKSGTPASSTHTISFVSTTIDLFQNRNIYQRYPGGTMAIADGANKQFTISGLGYGWAKLQLAFYGEGQYCNVEVTVGGLMAGGGTYYSATVIANGSSGNCDVNFGANQTSYVVTISNNVGNGGSIHGTALFTGQGGSAHPNLAVS